MDEKNNIKLVEMNNDAEDVKHELKKYKKYKWIISGLFLIGFFSLLVADLFIGYGKVLYICASLAAWLSFIIWG